VKTVLSIAFEFGEKVIIIIIIIIIWYAQGIKNKTRYNKNTITVI